MLCPVILHTYLCCTGIFLILTMLGNVKSSEKSLEHKEILIAEDMPGINDMKKYLTKLVKIVKFVNLNKPYVDATLFTGIFLINVNLINALQGNGRRLRLQKRRRFLRLVAITDDIMTYFAKTTQLDKYDKFSLSLERLFFNFVNNSAWPTSLQSFNMNLLNKTKFYTRQQLNKMYFKWPKYERMVYNINDCSPKPEESDTCLSELAQNPINNNEELIKCNISNNCIDILQNGTDFGYGITQRVLLLSMARLSFRCTFVSASDDIQWIDALCANMYNEAEFIAYHNFMLPHILMEQATLCSLHGHAQFLRRSWINELLDFQTSSGCFSLVRFNEETNEATTVDNVTEHLKIPNANISKSCNTFATAFAGAMLSAALRLIIEIV